MRPSYYVAHIPYNNFMRSITRREGERGQVMLIVTVLFTGAVTILGLGLLQPIMSEVRMSHNLQHSSQSYYAAEAANEDAYYRIHNNLTTSFPATMSLGGATVMTTVTPVNFTEEQILSIANDRNLIRSVLKTITVTDGFDFNFAIQAGTGGIYLYNNAAVNGDVYASGPVLGNSSGPNSYNVVNGGIVSAGASGLVSQVHASSSVHSHTITASTIDKDAYYQTFAGATSSVSVGGTKYPNSADQPIIAFPIGDSLIQQWETDASAGGTVTCSSGTYSISQSIILGPKKIPCDLSVTGNGTVVTLTGALWVAGNVTIDGSGGSGVQLKVSDSIGDKSVPVIADAADDQNSGTFTINGNANFYGSTGNANSYVMLVSQNSSAENMGSLLALDIINGAVGNLLVYAPHGAIKLENNVNLREVTAYKIIITNNAVVNYAIGLAQTLLSSGSGGAWKIKRWQEI